MYESSSTQLSAMIAFVNEIKRKSLLPLVAALGSFGFDTFTSIKRQVFNFRPKRQVSINLGLVGCNADLLFLENVDYKLNYSLEYVPPQLSQKYSFFYFRAPRHYR